MPWKLMNSSVPSPRCDIIAKSSSQQITYRDILYMKETLPRRVLEHEESLASNSDYMPMRLVLDKEFQGYPLHYQSRQTLSRLGFMTGESSLLF